MTERWVKKFERDGVKGMGGDIIKLRRGDWEQSTESRQCWTDAMAAGASQNKVTIIFY